MTTDTPAKFAPGEGEPVSRGLGLVHEENRSLRLTHDGNELVRYVYRPWDAQFESPRPYFHPVRTLEGDTVSLYRPHDHVWHKGIAWSLPNVGSANFWGGPTYLRDRGYVQLDNDGATVHRAFDSIEAAPETVSVTERLEWITQQGRTWFSERRGWRATVAPDHGVWTLVFTTSSPTSPVSRYRSEVPPQRDARTPVRRPVLAWTTLVQRRHRPRGGS